MTRFEEEFATFVLALQFLTRFPVRTNDLYTPERLTAATRYYPLVGALIGLVVAIVFVLASQAFTVHLAVLLSTAVSLLVTGAFHEDGFADACDGLGGGPTREHSLEIMKDSRLGTYGAAGLGLMLGAKILALAAAPLLLIPCLLVVGHAVSRGSAVVVIATSQYVRDSGIAKPVADGITPAGLACALITSGMCLLGLLVAAPPSALIGATVGLVVAHVVMRRFFEPKLGGYTGDCLGAVQQTSELGIYLGAIALL